MLPLGSMATVNITETAVMPTIRQQYSVVISTPQVSLTLKMTADSQQLQTPLIDRQNMVDTDEGGGNTDFLPSAGHLHLVV